MQYLKKSFNKISSNQKIIAIDSLIKELSLIKESINSNSNGNFLLEYLNLDIDNIKEEIKDLESESKDTYVYSTEEIIEMKEKIKELEKQKILVNDINNISVEKEKEYDHNEGWQTTYRQIKIKIELKNNIRLEIKFNHQYNCYDDSENFYKYFYIYKNNKILEKNKDYFLENDRYYNGRYVKQSEINSFGNFQQKLKDHCKKNTIDFDQLPQYELIKLIKTIKTETKKIKDEIKEINKNKITNWSILLNKIKIKFEDSEYFMNFFDKLD